MDFDIEFRDPQRVEVSGLRQSGHSPPRFFEKLGWFEVSIFHACASDEEISFTQVFFKLEYLEQKLWSDDIIVLSWHVHTIVDHRYEEETRSLFFFLFHLSVIYNISAPS